MCFVFFFNDTATTEIYTLSLHDALPILRDVAGVLLEAIVDPVLPECEGSEGEEYGHQESERLAPPRSEEHTSELQSHVNLVCRLLLEKKKKNKKDNNMTT